MIRLTDIQESYESLVGVRGDGKWLDANLTDSDSGNYLQDAHPLLTLENIRKCSPIQDTPNYEPFDGGKAYAVGDVCIIDGKLYQWDNIRWQPYTDPFSGWLTTKRQAAISKVVNRFLQDKINLKNGKTLLENKYLFETAGRIYDLIPNNGQLVGMEITPPRYPSVTVVIKKIGFQANFVGDITFYLYHSSSPYILDAKTLAKNNAGSFEYMDVDWVLPYAFDGDAGGCWYIVYRQDDLGDGQAQNKIYDWQHGPCPGCKQIDYNNYKAWSKWVKITPFKCNPADEFLPDVATMIPTYECNYGMNLQISVQCDVTNLLIDERLSFANVVFKQWSMDMLSELYFNAANRVNLDTQNGTYNTIYYEINGTPDNRKTGLKYELEEAFKAIEIDTRNMDAVCLPCNSKRLRVGSI